jgi:alkylation response protein AidB-like acyl-CoA dehydrogenase
VDLELTDEQTWIAESVDTLLARHGEERRWRQLVEFGALSGGLGAVELCLVARALGAHLAAVPYLTSAAARFAAPEAFAAIPEDETISVASLEPGGNWSTRPATELAGGALSGRKVAVEPAQHFVVEAVAGGEPVLALVARTAAGVRVTDEPSLDPTVPLAALDLDAAPARPIEAPRLRAIGALLAAAESVGAAGRLLEDARRYAAERRQFGRTIGSFQSLRHVLADMYVGQASAWSTVLYAAASLDDGDATRTASIAKAYVARSAREVAHGAMQVFGGIAFTAEHPAHRSLRRIVVREQQFGDALHHERALGRALAAGARAPVTA